MKFGKTDRPELINHKLPPDHPANLTVLKGKPADDRRLYFGGTMWNVPAWKGKIYPLKMPTSDGLPHYAKHFGTIELNATHYRTPSPETVVIWASQVPASFKFCPKWPQLITHFKRFVHCEKETDSFLETLHAFGDRLGTAFIQLPPHFTPAHATKLSSYLDSLPGDIRVAVEFRHPDWFSGDPSALKIWDFLADKAIGAVITDTSGRRDALHMRLCNSQVLLRFGGNNLIAGDYERMDEWADRLAKWYGQGLETCFVFMHQENSLLTPEACMYFAEALEQKTGLKATVPRIAQPGLF